MNWETYFLNLEYQKSPTVMQKNALKTLSSLNLFHDLKEFNPVFVGTIPLDVDVHGSDIDIICEVAEFSRFQNRVRECFESQKNFIIIESYNYNSRHSTCRFDAHSFRIEILGEKVPVQQQISFKKLVAEAKLLEIGGDTARQEIRNIKNQGLNTELAFAEYFKLTGEVQDRLRHISSLTIDEIKSLLKE